MADGKMVGIKQGLVHGLERMVNRMGQRGP